MNSTYSYVPDHCKTSSNKSAPQTFHQKIPMTYKLPSFSPKWDDYLHDATNKIEVYTTSCGDNKIFVYSAAQLHLLWESVFVNQMNDNVKAFLKVKNNDIEISGKSFNTILSGYSRMDTIPSYEAPDLANLSGFWVFEGESMKIADLYEIYPEGSYTTDNQGEAFLLSSLPVDPKFVVEAAKAYGIPAKVASTYKDFSQIKKWLVDKKRWDEKRVLNNVVFPPCVLVSPEYFQLPLTAFSTSKSALAFLTDCTSKITISNVNVFAKMATGMPYGATVSVGLFDSPTVRIDEALDPETNNGNYSTAIMSKPGDSCRVYTEKGKTLLTSSAGNQYNIETAASSFGYNIVIRSELTWKNWFDNNNEGSSVSNLIVPVWTAVFEYDVRTQTALSVLTQGNIFKNLTESLVNQIEELGQGGNTPTPTPPTQQTANPSSNAAQFTTYSDRSYRGLPGHQKINLIQQIAAEKQKIQRMKGKKKMPNGDTLALYDTDAAIETVLANPNNYPFQSFVSFKSYNVNHQEGTRFPFQISSKIIPVNSEAVIGQKEIKVAPLEGFNIPLCELGRNCYGRNGICQRKIVQNNEVAVADYQLGSTLKKGSELLASIQLGDIMQGNPIQVNGNNMDNLLSAEQPNEFYAAQMLACDKPDGDESFQDPGIPIIGSNVPESNGILQSILAFGGKCLNKLVSEEDNSLVALISEGRAANTLNLLKPVQQINKYFMQDQGKNQIEASFLMGELSANVVKGKDGVVPNTLEAWPADFQEYINLKHPELLEIPYVLPINNEDFETCTPGQVVINKTQITNLAIALGSNSGALGIAQNFRDNLVSGDNFTVQTSVRCFAILSSVPYGEKDFWRTAIICSDANGLVIAPSPNKSNHISAANGSASQNFYGSYRYDGNNYYIFNNVHMLSVNDLSGTIKFVVPSTMKVIDEQNNEVVDLDTQEYLDSGKRIFVCVYHASDIDVDVQLQSDINYIANPDTGTCNLSMVLYNVPKQNHENPSPMMFYQMPSIKTTTDGKLSMCDVVSEKRLGILGNYFYGVTDLNNVPQLSNAPDDEVKEELNKSNKKVRRPKDAFQKAQDLENKLPIGFKVKVLKSSK